MPPPHGYSHTVTIPATARLIYTSGQVGIPQDGSAVPTTFAEQAKLAFANVKTCLEDAGATVQDIIKIKYFIVDHDDKKLEELGAILETFFGGRSPAATLLGIKNLATKDYLIEVECIAAVV